MKSFYFYFNESVMDLGLILLILNMIILWSFSGPTHFYL